MAYTMRHEIVDNDTALAEALDPAPDGRNRTMSRGS